MTQTTISLDLPWPPSLNRIWRHKGKRVYLDPKYNLWITEAGWIIKAKRYQQIKGEFSANIVLHPPNKRLIDIDNRVKVLLDLAEKTQLIENDHLCRLLVVSYGEAEAAPLGAHLTLASMN